MTRFYIHDYETFGKSPSMDRPAQFAGVRTDMDFNIIEEPLVIYCAPADDYLPDPEAVLITGITPQYACAKGVNEAEFARQIHHVFSMPNTCILGYNNIGFDDEVSRNIFYRNFYDPYAYSWQNGNSRWDLLNVVRACYALRPDGVLWPKNKDGLPSFRLADLTRINGIKHTQAHDAWSDVCATIAVAKQVKRAQPRLFNFLLQYRSKYKLNTLIDIDTMTPLVHVSAIFGAVRGNVSWVAPLAWHPVNNNAVIMCDLAGDLTCLLTLNANQLRELLYTRYEALAVNKPSVPLMLVYINKCPVLAPSKTLLPEHAERLGIDRLNCQQNLQILRKSPQILRKVIAVFAEHKPYKGSDNIDARLYDGFFSDTDRAVMSIVKQTCPKNLSTLNIVSSDDRIKELLFRFRARNYFNTLNDVEQQRWLQYCKEVLSIERIEKYMFQLNKLYNLHEKDKEKIVLLHALFDYVCKIANLL
ncbi:exodeoxyribonuclease I [Serratia symbiotica str. 'Cinara cedri']|nr:exodeoxyribonuclease I [Serratia symbiotica str. 'Cinara cedri']